VEVSTSAAAAAAVHLAVWVAACPAANGEAKDLLEASRSRGRTNKGHLNLCRPKVIVSNVSFPVSGLHLPLRVNTFTFHVRRWLHGQREQ
jgi:hypothetical protein